jgi:hypothetical protein
MAHTLQPDMQGMLWVQGISQQGSAGVGMAGIHQSCTVYYMC